MRKKLALLLVMTTVALTACGAPKQDADTKQPESSVVESTEDTTAESTEVVYEVPAYVQGTYADNKFTSAYAGYTFTAPGGCTFMTAEELAAENGIAADVVAAGTDALVEAYAGLDTIIEFNASTANGANVYLQVNQMLTRGMTVEEYTQLIIGELTAMEGMTCEVVEETQVVEFIGKQCTKTLVSIEMEGFLLYQQYYFFVEPTHTGTVTVTYAAGMEAEKDALIAGFSVN